MKFNEILPWNWGKKKEPSIPTLFDEFWHSPFHSLWDLSTNMTTPRVEVNETDNEMVIRLEAPGMDEKDLTVDVYNGSLRVQGTKKVENEKKKKGYHYSECSYGSFSRLIPLPRGVVWDGAKAKYKKGVLEVKLPKKKRDIKQIAINVQ